MSVLLSDLQDGILTLTFNRPERANALNLEMIAALQEALRQAEREESVRCLILTGSGRAFGAGQDLEEIEAAAGTSIREHLQRTYNPLVLQIRRLEKPVLAAIHGACAGASLGIALACDLRLAATGTRFVVGFNGIGLVPDSGVSLFLPLLIGLGRATWFTWSNEPFSAEQALAWGMVQKVVPAEELQKAAQEVARELAAGPQKAFALTKRAFNRATLPQLKAILDYEAHLQEIAARDPEHLQRVRAFLARRK
ncbi:MAG: enoyl-CoA hydratase/isomerase family protein [Anaerolineales bacterium]